MGKKGSKFSKEHKRNLSLAWNYNKHFTEITRKNISEANKGKKRTDEAKERYSLSKLGKSHPAWNKGLTIKNKKVKKYIDSRLQKNNYKHSPSTKQIMSLLKKGTSPWNKKIKGKKYLKHCKNNSTWLMKNRTNEMSNKAGLTLKKLYSQGKLIIWNKGLMGDKSPAWLGGISFEPYSPNFNNAFKTLIKLRDNFCCINCNISEQKHIILQRRKLTVHHIDYDKKNTCLQNCCTLCVSCNSKANKNRNEWKEYYQEKLTNFYKYNYENSDEIIIKST